MMSSVVSVLHDFKPAIHRCAYNYGVDVDDLTQDIAVKLLERHDSIRKESAIPVIARTTAIDTARKFSRIEFATSVFCDKPAPADATVENRDFVQALEARLTEEHLRDTVEHALVSELYGSASTLYSKASRDAIIAMKFVLMQLDEEEYKKKHSLSGKTFSRRVTRGLKVLRLVVSSEQAVFES